MAVERLEDRHLLAVITTLAELQSMSLNGTHQLANDIDASGASFTPVGTSAAPFTGTLDGMGYKILGLRINTTTHQYVGLFGYTSGATIHNVELQNVDIDALYTSDSNYIHAGGLVGKAVNTSITAGKVSGDIDANSYGGVYAGGLVGYSSNTSDKDLTSSFSSASIDGRSDVNNNGYGGYAGFVGGLVGRADGLDVSGSSATGAVTAYSSSSYGGDLQYAGGLIGYNHLSAASGTNAGEVLNSFATGSVVAQTSHTYGGAYAGGLIGYNSIASSSTGVATFTLHDSYATGSVHANGNGSSAYGGRSAHAGGLVGYNSVTTTGSGSASASVALSYATGTADSDANAYGGPTPYAFAGGLIGYNFTRSSSSGSATTTVDQSFAKGATDAVAYASSSSYGSAYGYSGGLIGYSHVSSSSTGAAAATFDESYATGAANAYGYGGSYGGSYGGAYAGGLVGYDYLSKGASATANATISNSYATGAVTGRAPSDAVAGGLVGGVWASGTAAQITNSYSTGVPDTQYDSSPLEGGLVGYSSNTSYTSNYWDITTSGKTDGVDNIDPDPTGVTGLTTQQMSTQPTFSGWDFDADGTGPGANGVWIMAGYPHLQMEHKFLKTVAGKKSITNVVELQLMALKLNESYSLANAINASATASWNWDGTKYQGFAPVSTELQQFTGSFDGQNNVIQSLKINRPSTDELGLFGFVATTGTITNVGLQSVDITSYGVASDNTGGLAGKNRGTITDCYVTGTVLGNDDVGGITGENEGGTIERCYADITVEYRSGTDAIGALVGDNEGGTIRQSYGAGLIEGAYYIGGLVGWNRGVIEDSYATAIVEADYYAGGLVGYNSGNSTSITRSYASGDVIGISYVGGFLGYTSAPGASTTHSYAAGDVVGNTSTSTVGPFMGGGNANSASSNYYAGQATNLGSGGINTSGAAFADHEALENAAGPGAHAVYSTWNLATVWREHPGEADFPKLQWQPSTVSPIFDVYSLADASLDDTPFTTFENGAQRLSYTFYNAGIAVVGIWLEALQGGTVAASWGMSTVLSQSNRLINLDGSGLDAGAYGFRAKAQLTNGQTIYSNQQPIEILPAVPVRGSFQAETFNYSTMTGSGAVILGAGGTDTLTMGLSTSSVASLNGASLASFDPAAGATMDQAIYRGTAFDFLRLQDGREIYFQGIERLVFSDGVVVTQVQATDPGYAGQWNVHAQDLGGAWRFTQGHADVLLVSLDTGVLTPTNGSGGIFDLDTNRLITDPTDDDPYSGTVYYGHGHQAISIMSATANNGANIAGFNWVSDVMVADVYGGVSFHTAVDDAIDLARAQGLRVVFQGGVQGNSWLTSGGTRAALEAMINNNDDITLFAVAAGNSGGAVDGVAALQTTHENVIAVGAATRNLVTVNGLTNASAVYRASYSQHGQDLTMMAATDVPAVNKSGSTTNFNGTSAANPNMAGIASLVWSINPNFDGGEVRQTLIETATDIDDAGWDTETAHGFVNADAAVRRALAWVRDAELAGLADSADLMVLHNGIEVNPPPSPPGSFDDSSSGQLPPPVGSAVWDRLVVPPLGTAERPSPRSLTFAGHPASERITSPERLAALDAWYSRLAARDETTRRDLRRQLEDRAPDSSDFGELLSRDPFI